MCDPDNTPSGICVCRTDGNGGGYWACGTFGTRCASGLVCEDNNNGTVSCVDPLDPSLSESIAPSPVETIQLVATP